MICNIPNYIIYERFFKHHPEYVYLYLRVYQLADHNGYTYVGHGRSVTLQKGECVLTRFHVAKLLDCTLNEAKSCIDCLVRAGYLLRQKSKKFFCSVYSFPYIKNPVPGTYTSVEIPFGIDERFLKRGTRYALPTYIYLSMSANKKDWYDLHAHKVIEEGCLVVTTTRIARCLGATVDQVRYVLQQLLELKAISIEGMRGVGVLIKINKIVSNRCRHQH